VSTAITTTQAPDNLRHIEQNLYRLPSLEQTFEAWDTAGSPPALHDLELRQELLGAATLSSVSLRLLYAIATEHISALQTQDDLSAWYRRPLNQRILRHAATLSAAETQALLPTGVLVQKTVSLAMARKLLMCTSLGDQHLERADLRVMADELTLPRRAARQCTINPAMYDPITYFGVQPGMVSPFLHPRHARRLAAMVLIPWPKEWEEREREVAVSLSLWESLLLPSRCLREIVCGYARQAYPQILMIELQREENRS